MKPGGPLKRRKPNAKRLRRRGQVLNPRPDITDLRVRVYERAGGRCDLCGQALSWGSYECHHRKKRSQGGADDMTNLIALHRSCHHDRVHGEPAWSYEHGFMVRRDSDPAVAPLLRHGSRWQVPGDTQWHGAPAPEAA